jgi:hypothetical protein
MTHNACHAREAGPRPLPACATLLIRAQPRQLRSRIACPCAEAPLAYTHTATARIRFDKGVTGPRSGTPGGDVHGFGHRGDDMPGVKRLLTGDQGRSLDLCRDQISGSCDQPLATTALGRASGARGVAAEPRRGAEPEAWLRSPRRGCGAKQRIGKSK